MNRIRIMIIMAAAILVFTGCAMNNGITGHKTEAEAAALFKCDICGKKDGCAVSKVGDLYYSVCNECRDEFWHEVEKNYYNAFINILKEALTDDKVKEYVSELEITIEYGNSIYFDTVEHHGNIQYLGGYSLNLESNALTDKIIELMGDDRENYSLYQFVKKQLGDPEKYKISIKNGQITDYDGMGEIKYYLGNLTGTTKEDKTVGIPAQGTISLDETGNIINMSEAEKQDTYDNALRAYAKKDYLSAYELFDSIRGYKDSTELADKVGNEIKYMYAVGDYNAGAYDDALEAFRELGDYEDSRDYISKIISINSENEYLKATGLYETEEYEQAYRIFDDLAAIDYSDSRYMADCCLKGQQYIKAIGLMKIGNTDDALKIFRDLSGFKMSDLFAWCANNNVECYYENDYPVIKLGRYLQDYYEDSDWYGLKQIEWYVIGNNGNSYTLLSKYILDYHAYDENPSLINMGQWKDSPIREWLNDYFYTRCSFESFVSLDPTYISGRGDFLGHYEESYSTVYLLSYDEVKDLPDNIKRATPTDYAKYMGVSMTTGEYAWWLRSLDTNRIYFQRGADNVRRYTEDGFGKSKDGLIGVRPSVTLWISSYTAG